MKKLLVILIVMLSGQLTFSQPHHCNNFPCGTSTPWSVGVEQTVQSLFCPDCEWKITFNWRIVNCNGQTRLQINFTGIAGLDIECYQDNPCDWSSMTREERFEDAYYAFIEWTRGGSLFGFGYEYIEYSFGQCWKYTYVEDMWGLMSGWNWKRCLTAACCIWVYEKEYDPLTGDMTLSNPVLIEPSFEECNPFTNFPFQTEYCYSFCGLFPPHSIFKLPGNQKTTVLSAPDIFPNPADEKVTVTVNMSEEIPYGIKILDSSGKELKNQSFVSSNTHPSLNTSELPNGTYFLQIVLNDSYVIYSNSFVISR